MDTQDLSVSTDTSELCRICATCTSGLVIHYIFEKSEFPIAKKMTICLPVSVNEEDRLSQLICDNCLSKLDMVYNFRNLSIKTEQYLKSLVKSEFTETSSNSSAFEISEACHSEIETSDQLSDADSVLSHIKAKQMSNLHGGKTIVENIISCTNQQYLSSRPIRAVRLNSKISYDSDSILESLLQKKSLVKTKAKKNLIERKKETVLKQCKYCKLVFTSQEYSIHVQEEHKKEFECNTCQERFASAERLEHHIQTADHSSKQQRDESNNQKILQCNTCQKTFTRKHLLILHLRRHTGERPFPCNLCERKYACKSSLKSHLLKHKKEWKHICSYCGKGFVDKHSFVYHIRSNHTGERPFICGKCDKKFIKKQDLLKHEQTQHSEMPKELFACESCGRVCKDYDALRSHRRSHIPVETRRVHKCTLCESSFTGKTGLMKHMHRHTGEMPYECEQCVKRFFTKKGLELHLVIHSGVKSFVCEYCGRAFSQDNTLRVHRRTHTGERPYECSVCFKRFTQSSALNSHKKLHLKDN